jgi:hypothetical protein
MQKLLSQLGGDVNGNVIADGEWSETVWELLAREDVHSRALDAWKDSVTKRLRACGLLEHAMQALHHSPTSTQEYENSQKSPLSKCDNH